MRAIGYARRSKESVEKTVSLYEQDQAIREYATAHDLEVQLVIVDDGISGTDVSRLPKVWEALKVHNAGAVIVYSIDRLHRDFVDGLTFARQLDAKGIPLHIVSTGPVNIRTEGGYLNYAFGGVVAELYVVATSQKTTAALARKRKLGLRYSGIPPYGYKHSFEGKLVEVPHEQDVILTIKSLHSSGHSIRKIIKGITEVGVRARNGGIFGTSLVHKIIKGGGHEQKND